MPVVPQYVSDLYVSPSLEWMRPFLLRAATNGYALPYHVRAYKPPRISVRRVLLKGNCLRIEDELWDGSRAASVTIHTHAQGPRGGLIKLTRGVMMANLAHELAHQYVMPHGKRHDRMTRKILRAMGWEILG